MEAPTPDPKGLEAENYIRFVKFLVGRMHYWPLEFDDAVQEGSIGLFKAIRDFNPDLNVKFTSYASRRIEGEVRDAKRKMLKRGSIESGAVNPNITHGDIADMQIEDESQLLDHEEVERELLSNLKDFINYLSERDQYIVREHYYNSRNLKDVAKDLNLSESRVCHLAIKALLDLKSLFYLNDRDC